MIRRLLRAARALAGLGFAVASVGAHAHPLDPALLELVESGGGAVAVAWHVPAAQPVGTPLRPLLPRHCSERSAPDTVAGEQRVVTRWSLDCGAGGIVGARIGVAGLRERGTDALVRVVLADGRVVQAVLRGDQTEMTVPAGASRLAVVVDYLRLGVLHILTGLDHLLFVLGLVLLVRGLRRLVGTITAFTLGHSLTLALATLGFVAFPSRVIEAAIALTIFAVAVELAEAGRARGGWLLRAPWLAAFGFGLLHGLGFAGALAEVGLPPHEIPAALFAFNVGIEIGQLAFVAAVLLARALLRALPVRWPAAAAQIPAYLIGSLAAYWTIERTWGAFAT